MEYNSDVIKSKYKLVPRTLVFIEKDDEILLIDKNKKDSFGYAKLNGIGGHIERGEEPYEAAKREICEESGLFVKSLELFAIIFIEIGIDPGILMFVFKAEYLKGELIASDEGNLHWMKKSDIHKNQRTIKDLPFLLKLAESHSCGSPPVFGKYLYDENKELRIVI